MPFSFGVLLGLIIAVFGAILFFATRRKRIAVAIMGVGLAIAILTFILIVLAANSPM